MNCKDKFRTKQGQEGYSRDPGLLSGSGNRQNWVRDAVSDVEGRWDAVSDVEGRWDAEVS